jgi:hypothetical protein
VLGAVAERPTWLAPGGIEAQLRVQADAIGYRAADSANHRNVGRFSARANLERPFGKNRLSHTPS